MHRIGLLVLLLSFHGSALADDATAHNIQSIHLNCHISFNNYDHVQQADMSKEVTVSNIKNKSGGVILVAQTKGHEFWVMAHGVQSIGLQSFITNFQVAIKHKASGLFMHALSDTSHDPSSPPKQSRISLVDYHPNSTLESGELIFECNTVAGGTDN